jgi:hypothetical protein
MTENEVAEAVAAWAVETLPELNASYHYLSASKGALPDVMVDVDEKTRVAEHPAFPGVRIQQADLRVFELTMALMVESGDGPTADKDETEQLRDFGSRLETALVADATLGERVPMAAPAAVFNYRLPFVQYDDGTRGRQMTVTMFVAEPVRSLM